MSNVNVNYYRIYCQTDSKWEYIWSEDLPTVCPVNDTHTVTVGSASQTYEKFVESKEVIINEETIKTGGNYCFESVSFSINNGETSDHTFNFDIPVSVLTGFLRFTEVQNNDKFWLYIHPSLNFGGVITSDVAINDTVINIDALTMSQLYLGLFIELFDGVNTSNLIKVIGLDKINSTMTLKTGIDKVFLSSSPTYVLITKVMIPGVILGHGGELKTGAYKIGGAHIPVGIQIKLIYENNSGSTQTPVYHMEYLY